MLLGGVERSNAQETFAFRHGNCASHWFAFIAERLCRKVGGRLELEVDRDRITYFLDHEAAEIEVHD